MKPTVRVEVEDSLGCVGYPDNVAMAEVERAYKDHRSYVQVTGALLITRANKTRKMLDKCQAVASTHLATGSEEF